MTPIQVPQEWPDADGLITVDEFCMLIRIPPRTVREWRRRHAGPRWVRFDACGRFYITVAVVRRFLHSATSERREVRIDG